MEYQSKLDTGEQQMPRADAGTYIGKRPMKRIIALVHAMEKGSDHDEGCKQSIVLLLTDRFARSKVRP